MGRIGPGLCVLLGAGQGDAIIDVDWMFDKIINLRIFSDEQGKMNRSLLDVGGGLLVVSQFTLYAEVKRGRRPFFGDAMEPVQAEQLYEAFLVKAREQGITTAAGSFGADMEVELVNDGPVTICLDSRAT